LATERSFCRLEQSFCLPPMPIDASCLAKLQD
jgi:hypothetical protein